jgi:hypothetical protein
MHCEYRQIIENQYRIEKVTFWLLLCLYYYSLLSIHLLKNVHCICIFAFALFRLVCLNWTNCMPVENFDYFWYVTSMGFGQVKGINWRSHHFFCCRLTFLQPPPPSFLFSLSSLSVAGTAYLCKLTGEVGGGWTTAKKPGTRPIYSLYGSGRAASTRKNYLFKINSALRPPSDDFPSKQ